MMVSLNYQNSDISKFEIAVDFFKSALTDASNFLLKKITENVKAQNKKLESSYKYYEQNSHLLLDDKMTKEYVQLDNATDVYEILLQEVEEYKDVSPEFMELYQAIKAYYETLVVVPTELGFIQAHLMHEQERLKNAS